VQRKLRRFRVLIFTLAILMSLCLASPRYDSLGQIHFLPPGLTLENFEIADGEGLLTDSPAPSKEIVSASFVNLSHQGIHPLQDLFRSYLQPSLLEQKLAILRC